MAKNQLLRIMSKLGLPLKLLTWVSSFLSGRLLRLAFDGQVEEFKSIDIGIPQGSLVSPILLLIYIKDMFTSRSVKFLSNIDDIAVTVPSPSLKTNIKILEMLRLVLRSLGFLVSVVESLDE